MFLLLPIYFFWGYTSPRYLAATSADIVVCSIYFLSAAVSFMLSTMSVISVDSLSNLIKLIRTRSHTFLCYSAAALGPCSKLHFQGHVLLLWGANVPLIYYGFFCSSKLQILYWILTSASALACSILTYLTISLRGRPIPSFTAASFGCLALSMFIPVIHGLAAYGLPIQIQRLDLKWSINALVCLNLGTAAYLSNVAFLPKALLT